MVALFFAISPEDLKDYEDWSENDYEDEYEDYEEDYYDDYYEYDRYGNYNKYKLDFIRPIFFDELLSNFVNNLSQEKLKSILIDELKRDEKNTFNNYLKKEFQKYISDKNNIHAVLDKVNKSFYKLSHDYDYNNKDYTINLLTKSEKENISSAYDTSKDMKANIDRIILNPEIATYNNYKWIAILYKNKNSKIDIENYTKKLESFFDTLKHYSIKNTIPKSNVLIAIYLLNDYNIQETSKLLIKNCKYTEYVDYIIKNAENCNSLYNKFNEIVENEKYLKERFYDVVAEEKSRDNYKKAVTYIGALYKLNDGEKIVNELINKLKNSEYSKRIALFDEINKVIKNSI